MSEQEERSRWSEKMELVFETYAKVFDLELALTLVPLSDAERDRAREDPELLSQVIVALAKEKERIITAMHGMSEDTDPKSKGNRLQAIKMMGLMHFPEKFGLLSVQKLNLTADKPILVQIIDDVPGEAVK